MKSVYTKKDNILANVAMLVGLVASGGSMGLFWDLDPTYDDALRAIVFMALGIASVWLGFAASGETRVEQHWGRRMVVTILSGILGIAGIILVLIWFYGFLSFIAR